MMRNKEVLNEIRKQSRTLIEEKRDKFVKQSLLSDEFIDMMQRNRKPFDLLMSYYQCAIMEIETKFKVLNEEYSLEYDKNPIEGIKSIIKSYDSLLKKIRRKDIPMTLESIEKNITDIRIGIVSLNERFINISLWYLHFHQIHYRMILLFGQEFMYT